MSAILKKSSHKQKLAIAGLVAAGSVLNLAFLNCSGNINASTRFSLDPAGVVGKTDILTNQGTDTNTLSCASIIQRHNLKDCGAPVLMPDGSYLARKDWERQQVLAEVAADNSLVPVQFAYSFGTKLDELAVGAHHRAILTKERNMLVSSNGQDYTVVPAGTLGDAHTYGYYKADHSAAKQQYIQGDRCYFSTVKLTSGLSGGYKFDFITNYIQNKPYPSQQQYNGDVQHGLHYMFMGYSASGSGTVGRYGPGAYSDEYPNRIFGTALTQQPIYAVNSKGLYAATGQSEPQFIKLYVADLRDKQFGLSTANSPIVRVDESNTRGLESSKSTDQFLDISTILANFDVAVANLSSNMSNEDYDLSFSGLDGAKQLIANLCSASLSGTVLATQYTPVAVDLGRENIITSGVGDGVYFNMSLKTSKAHKTAWLSGAIEKSIARAADGSPFYRMVKTQVEDGFLVIPNADGSITDSRNLFGTKMMVNGKTYANGFEALKALADKKCDTASDQDKFLGPWDGSKYDSVVKVWVDKNENGKAEVGEVISLREAGVAAVGVCYTDKYGMKDSYGNKTALRSIMIYQKPMVAANDEIMSVIQDLPVQSNTAAGLKKRLAIDILFKADDGDFYD